MRERDPSFGDVLLDAWNNAGRAQSVPALSHKLTVVAEKLQSWGRASFGAVRSELRHLRTHLEELRLLPGRVGPSAEEDRVEARMVELCLREEIMWRQRARIQWLAEGDSNTKFFHRKASARKAKNRIVELQRPDGTMCKEEHEMAGMATSFYSNLYASESTVGIEEVLSHIPTRVDAPMNITLDAKNSKTEVKEALFQMFPTKAPGPDGFPAHFFQRHWELYGDEVTEMVLRVLNGEDSPEEINKTFIIIIPKVLNPTYLIQFQPISICNVIFKIAEKLLAN